MPPLGGGMEINMKRIRSFIARLFAFTAVMVMCGTAQMNDVRAQEKEPELTIDGDKNASDMTDGSYYTNVRFTTGDKIIVSASDGSTIHGLYIMWDSPIKPWTLETDNGTVECGQNGFLHEYIKLEEGTKSAVVNIPADATYICNIRIFDSTDIPEDVQTWNAPCEEADIMLVAAHADDEILFLGGIIPTYGVADNAKVQVVYMTQFWDTARIREHEKLDGLWTDGCRYYPVSAGFTDMYSESIDTARTQYDEDAMIEFITEQIRRFKPQVIVTHDFNGEYGHGYHRLTADAVKNAIDAAPDSGKYTNSAEKYGTWDTPKAYFHLYQENRISLNLREPIEAMDGMTAVEVAAAAYKRHVSQQWCWFYVSDDYQYSCAEFGLYRTLVGADTENNMLENIKTYTTMEEESIQESIEASVQESIAESISESESESVAESQSESIRQSEEESESISQSEQESLEIEHVKTHTRNTVTAAVAIVLAVLLTVFIIVLFKSKKGGKTDKGTGNPKRKRHRMR